MKCVLSKAMHCQMFVKTALLMQQGDMSHSMAFINLNNMQFVSSYDVLKCDCAVT